MSTDEKKRVLIIEDERMISEILAVNIKKAGFEPVCRFDGKSGLDEALAFSYDLILLDLMLPGIDGFEVCRRLRQKKDTPVIILTAREEENDKILGLELGADDYLTKPFSVPELISRIKANIRRYSNELVQDKLSSDIIRIGRITINNANYEVLKDGEHIELSKKQYELLIFLVQNHDRVFSREELMTQVWGYDGFYGDMRTVDVTITRLRKQLEDNPALPEYIQTKRGKGYVFVSA